MSIKKYKLFYFVIVFFSLQEPRLEAAFTVNMDPDTREQVDKVTQVLNDLPAKTGEEVRKTLPIMRNEASIWFKDAMPELEKSLKKSGKEVTSALRMVLSPLKMVPILGMGLAGSVAAIMMLRKGIEKYLESDQSEKKDQSKGRKLIFTGCMGILLSSLIMVKSDSIVKFFSS